MDIASACPFPTAKIVWQSPRRVYALTVIVRATFQLRPGTSVLAATQEPIHDRDKPWEEDPRQSVRIPSDHAPYKPRADVLLVGHAYAPDKQPARSVTTRLVVGDVDKLIEVHCDRVLRVIDGQLLEGRRFTHMPLRWERAAGGPNSPNPLGMRFDAPPDAYGVIPIANLQPPGTIVSKCSDAFAPVCYAPVSPMWPGRTQTLGRLSRRLVEGGWENEPLPEDFDPVFFQVAPADQTTREIRPDEKIVLENLHPEHAQLVTILPGLRPRAVAERATGEREEVALVGDTLWMDTDRGIGCVVWRGRIGLRHATEAGRISIWADGLRVVESAVRRPQPRQEETLRVSPDKVPKEPALPFLPGLSRLAVPTAGDERPAPRRRYKEAVETLRITGDRPAEPVLPFHKKEALAETRSLVDAREPQPVPILIAPPPMMGPLATAEMADHTLKTPEPITTAQEPIPVEVRKRPGPHEFPLERCAAMTASIARRRAQKEAILVENELTAKEWGAIETFWGEAMKDETRKGKRTLLDRFDRAYVAQIEAERGPITVEEYAKLSVGSERGTIEEVLQELGLPRGAVMRVERVWMNRGCETAAIEELVRNAIDFARTQ